MFQIKHKIIKIAKLRHMIKRPNLMHPNFMCEGMTPGVSDLSTHFGIAASFWSYLRDLTEISLDLFLLCKIFLKMNIYDMSILRCCDKSKT